MGMIERFKSYTAALEQAYRDDDWSRLAPYFAENASYRSYYGGDIEVTGRDAVLNQLRAEAESFDRKFDSRVVEYFDGPREERGRIFTMWRVTYSKAGSPDLVLTGNEIATFIGDEMTLLEGHYQPEVFAEFSSWLNEYGSFVHAS
ncbi:MAG: nuclear transport factor 2 family protein [Deltaproteobacteria bacterium]|jgi:hypothetical protein|nr:nuclear transport factor 2 family protein [Deltaproteobacteria bacterium]